MWSWSNENMPILFFAILHPGDSSRTDFLVDAVVQRRLEAEDGVGKLEVWGVLDDSMRILLDEDKVRAANLDLGELIGRLSRDNFALPLGEVTDGDRRVTLRSDMRFRNRAEIEAYPIGGGLLIGDIGHVQAAKSVRNRLFKIDGSYAYYGEIQKDSQSNVVETCARLRATLEELERDPRLEGEFKFLVLFDQGEFIENSLGQLKEAALWGGGLAVVLLFVFLRRVRSTLAVALSIPFSALVAIAWMHFGGGTFNVLSMTGITLAMGMLVDDAVVVIENIARVAEHEGGGLDAAARGTREVALAVVLSTLTTVVMFLPMIFMGNDPTLRIILGELGLPMCLSLMLSLVAALVFLPVVAARVVVPRHAWVERAARALRPVAEAPARVLAWSLGFARISAFALAKVLRSAVAAFVRVIAQLRWVVAAALIGLGAWRATQAWTAMQLARHVIDDFGGSARVSLDQLLVMAIEVCALPLALALVLLALPRLSRKLTGPLERPLQFVSRGRSLLDAMIALNTVLLRWTLSHRVAAVFLYGAALLSVLWPVTHMSVAAFGEDENTQRMNVMIELEDNFTLAQAEVEMEYYEHFFTERQAQYGYDHLANRFDPRSGRISLYWNGTRSREQHQEVERDIRTNLAARAGHTVRFGGDEGAANERNKNMVTFRLVGPDSEELARLGQQAAKLLERVPGLSSVSLSEGEGQSQVRVQFDSDLAQGFGIAPNAALENIAWALRGWQLPRYQEEGREVPLIIEYDEQDVAGLGTLRDLEIFNGTSSVPLSSFASFEFARGERRIERRNGQTSFSVQARVEDPMRQKELSDAGYAALQGLELPRGYALGAEDLVGQRQEAELKELVYALLLGLLLSYIVMAILFESLLLPFAVMFTVPYAMLGAFWTLYLTKTPMDSVGWIGIIILGGVVAKNGIVLVDCVRRLRDGGLDRREAVLRGSALRLRPVLMTALATVLGLIPMAVAEPASEGIDYRALATLIAGGLSVTTVFTLWVVPLAYTLCDDLWRAIGSAVSASLHLFVARRRAATAVEA